jgi:hypothetical protein
MSSGSLCDAMKQSFSTYPVVVQMQENRRDAENGTITLCGMAALGTCWRWIHLLQKEQKILYLFDILVALNLHCLLNEKISEVSAIFIFLKILKYDAAAQFILIKYWKPVIRLYNTRDKTSRFYEVHGFGWFVVPLLLTILVMDRKK